jgi:hypothetical protein
MQAPPRRNRPEQREVLKVNSQSPSNHHQIDIVLSIAFTKPAHKPKNGP